MFMGEYSHTIDTKGRLIIPSKFREELGETFVVTKGLDGCLFVFSDEEWKAFEIKLNHYHLPIRTPGSLHAFSWRVRRPVNWTSRGESSYRRR